MYKVKSCLAPLWDLLFLILQLRKLNLREKNGFIQSHTVEGSGFERTSARFQLPANLTKGKSSFRERAGQL